MKKKIFIILGIITLSIILIILYLFFNVKNNHKIIKSGNLATDYSVNQALGDIKSLNLNTINIPIVVNIPDKTSNDITIEKWSLDRAIELIKKLQGSEIKIIIEPYPWIKNGSISETEYNPYNKEEFFKKWNNDILTPIIKQVANPYNVYAVIVASNFNLLDKYEDNWISTIQNVRKIYKGNITYKVSWWKTAIWDKNDNNRFKQILNDKVFKYVNFISIAAYFELSNKQVNTVNELVSDLYSTTSYNRKQDVYEQIYELHRKWDKPIYFGELGFPRKDGAAMEPWNPECSNIINGEEQARCFEAYKKVFGNKRWFKGYSVFSIGINNDTHLFYPSPESKKVIENWN